METITHTLRFTVTGEHHEDEEFDENEYDDWEASHDGPIRPGMTCGYWEECGVEPYEATWTGFKGETRTYRASRCSHTPTEEEIDAGEYFAHGEEHVQIEDSFMTFCGCALTGKVDGVVDAVDEIFRAHGFGPHSVDPSYWGDGSWDVDRIG